MSLLDVELVVVVVKHDGVFRWFRSDRELWILDYQKWKQDFVDAGYELPASAPEERFGIPVVNEHTIDQFLAEMEQFEIERSKLEKGLKVRFPNANSWWDVGKLFPIMFVDCDKRHVAAFYPDGARMERYVPDGWTGGFDDFGNNSSEEDFPTREKFWVQDGVDLLAILNERGEKLTEHD
jgi:hypothetical protein